MSVLLRNRVEEVFALQPRAAVEAGEVTLAGVAEASDHSVTGAHVPGHAHSGGYVEPGRRADVEAFLVQQPEGLKTKQRLEF